MSATQDSRAALLDYVRGILAERDALIADNERLSVLYEQAVKGRADMRSALREARAAAPQPVGAAEVPMPEPVATFFFGCYDGDELEEWTIDPICDKCDALNESSTLELADRLMLESEVRIYGEAREAAGYARGLAEVNAALNDVFSAADGLSSAIDAALRGEVK